MIYQAPLFPTAGGPGPGGAFMGTGLQRTYSGGLNYDHIFSPTRVANVRVGVSYCNNTAQGSDYGQNDSTALCVPGVNISPFTSGFVSTQLNDGISAPMTGYSASLPWVRSEANVDIVNTYTKTMRNHTFKWGVDLKRVRDNLLPGSDVWRARNLLLRQPTNESMRAGKDHERRGFELQSRFSTGRLE